MTVNLNDLDVVHNVAESRFEIQLDDSPNGLAVAEYRLRGNELTVHHTGVPVPYRGNGIAGKLARQLVEHAQANGYRVIPQCSYIAAWIRRHPEYHAVTER